MENTSATFRKVHIVQPAFLASELLSVDIEKFIKVGASSPRLLFLGSVQAEIGHEKTYGPEYQRAVTDANRRFEGSAEQFSLQPKVSMRFLANKALQFQVVPVEQAQFQKSLDEINALSETIHTVKESSEQYLNTTIPQHLLAPEEQLFRAARLLRDRIQSETENTLYSVSTYKLVDKLTEIPN